MWSARPSPPAGGSHGAERLGKVTPRVWQVWIKELNASEPLMTGREGVQSVKSYEVHGILTFNNSQDDEFME